MINTMRNFSDRNHVDCNLWISILRQQMWTWTAMNTMSILNVNDYVFCSTVISRGLECGWQIDGVKQSLSNGFLSIILIANHLWPNVIWAIDWNRTRISIISNGPGSGSIERREKKIACNTLLEASGFYFIVFVTLSSSHMTHMCSEFEW